MSIITTLENEGHKALTAIEHAGAWLVGAVAQAEVSLSSLEASSPLIAQAIAAGEDSATAHGVPIVAVEDGFNAVMTAAKELASGLTAPPPAPANAAVNPVPQASDPATADPNNPPAPPADGA
jgi:hypothetical protein